MTPIFGWKSLSVSCHREKGSLGVSCRTRKAMLMVCSGENPAGWINLEEEENKKKITNSYYYFCSHCSNNSAVSLGALCQLDVSVQAVGWTGVEDERFCHHALYRRVSSRGQTERFHHVKPCSERENTDIRHLQFLFSFVQKCGRIIVCAD